MVSNKDFVHLHCHSEYSALDGFGHIQEYIDKVVDLGQPGIGCSDHGNTFAIYELVKKAKEADITPVPGCEFYVAPQNPEGAFRKESVFYGPNGQKAAEYDVSSNGAYTHQTIFAVNNTGLSNLFKLSSLSFDPARYYQKPRIDFEMLAEHSDGLVAFTGCPSSEVSTRFLLNQDKEAYEYANRLKEVFGDRLFVEIMEHGMTSPIERLLLPKQMELSRKMGIPLIATNDNHYTHQHEARHHEEMLCSQSGARMTDATWDNGGTRFAFDGDQFYFKSSQEMAALFPEKDYPGALSNTLLVAEMAQGISLDYDPNLKPRSIIPEGYSKEVDYFRHLVEVGFRERYGNHPEEAQEEARRRIEHEFEVIHSSNYVGYFLTVYEYLNYARNKYSTKDELGNILASALGAGRGSVGGSVIAYVLKISEIDPVRWETIFERFLSSGRGDTYLIEYEDGTTEEIVVSENKIVHTETGEEKKYIHELKAGDIVVSSGAESTPERPLADDSSESEPVEVETPTEPEEAVEADSIAPELAEEVEIIQVEAPRKKQRKQKEYVWIDLGLIPESDLSDISTVPF